MPVRRFWLMAGNVNRILAERDLRTLSLSVAAQSKEAHEQKHEDLVREMGMVSHVEHKFDPAGWEALRGMASEV
jgi:hypothetical protein